MTTAETAFREIEYKYLVDSSFDAEAFYERVRNLKPDDEYSSEITDTYFSFPHLSGYVYRHRFDGLLQDLSVKSLGGDLTDRLEINLHLALECGSQIAAVRAFFSLMGEYWAGALTKKVKIFLFPDCELVHYTASNGEAEVRCIEIESRQAPTRAAAVTTLDRYSSKLQLHQLTRANQSLFEMLLMPKMPQSKG